MKFTKNSPCAECPFLKEFSYAFSLERLREFADDGCFVCHKTAEYKECDDSKEEERESGYYAKENGNSIVCAGMLIFNEKRKHLTTAMQIAERLNLYDPSKLTKKHLVRTVKK